MNCIMNISELEQLIVGWGKDKGLIQHTQAQAVAQHSKTVEAVGELLKAIAALEDSIKAKRESGMWAHQDLQNEVRLKAGNVLVALVIQCEIQGYNLGDAIALSHNYKGTAVKESLAEACKVLGQWIGLADDQIQSRWILIGVAAKLVGEAIASYDLSLDECLEAAWF